MKSAEVAKSPLGAARGRHGHRGGGCVPAVRQRFEHHWGDAERGGWDAHALLARLHQLRTTATNQKTDTSTRPKEAPVPEAVIVAAARTPVGRAYKGALKDMRPDDLAAHAVRAALEQLPGFDGLECGT